MEWAAPDVITQQSTIVMLSPLLQVHNKVKCMHSHALRIINYLQWKEERLTYQRHVNYMSWDIQVVIRLIDRLIIGASTLHSY